jgi:hypothetical protein
MRALGDGVIIVTHFSLSRSPTPNDGGHNGTVGGGDVALAWELSDGAITGYHSFGHVDRSGRCNQCRMRKASYAFGDLCGRPLWSPMTSASLPAL